MTTARVLQELNAAPRAAALRMLEPIVERSAWVAAHVVRFRPFTSDQDVAQRLVDTILTSSFEQRIALFRGHPQLAGQEAVEGTMTQASTDEQGRLGLTSLALKDAERLTRMNADYEARFGHPFILALHRVPDLQSVFGTFERRLMASPVEEHVTTLAEIASVISARAARAFGVTAADPAENRSDAASDRTTAGVVRSEATDG